MRNAIHALVLLAASAAVNAAAGDGATTSDLTIHATGFESARGHAIAKLFVPGDNVLGTGHWQLSAPIEGGVVGAIQLQFIDALLRTSAERAKRKPLSGPVDAERMP